MVQVQTLARPKGSYFLRLENPNVLVDVDGVINWWKAGEGRPSVDIIQHGGVWIPQGMAALMAEVKALASELWWCTAWRLQANDHISPLLGLPSLPVVMDKPPYGSGADWKAAEVERLLQRGKLSTPVVWIEDFAQSWLDPYQALALEDRWRGEVHLVDTSEVGCLLRSHLEGWFL